MIRIQSVRVLIFGILCMLFGYSLGRDWPWPFLGIGVAVVLYVAVAFPVAEEEGPQ
jgi:hypothetical protein